jgi:hypothetical protein
MGLTLKSYDSQAAETPHISLWEPLPKGFFIFGLFLSIRHIKLGWKGVMNVQALKRYVI